MGEEQDSNPKSTTTTATATAVNDFVSDDNFFDALDEFPSDGSNSKSDDQSVSISHASSSIESKHVAEYPSPAGVRRRRSLSQLIRKDLQSSSVSFDSIISNSTMNTIHPERKFRFLRNFKENEKFRARFGSGSIVSDQRLKDEVNVTDSSTITTANDERIAAFDDSIVESRDASSSFLFTLASLIIKAIGFQVKLLVSFFTSPIWLVYSSYMFVMDPFRVMRGGRDLIVGKILQTWGLLYGGVKSSLRRWIKKNKTTLKLFLRLGWGLLWSTYVCFVLVSLLVSAFVFSWIVVKFTVEDPIQMKEELNFDYTRESPIAFVPIMSCPDQSCGVHCGENIDFDNVGGTRVISPNHKLQATVSLTLPESDYNRNLGIFQVRVDLLSANGKVLSSSRQPCMLQFKSEPIRLLSTFLKMVPLVTGYSSESETLKIKFRGFTERDVPTSCLRVTMEQRAEFRAGAGIPEIYGASLNLDSELPLLKRILWSWKRTIFVWSSMVFFTIELLFTLICCKPVITPKGRLRGDSPGTNSSQHVRPTQLRNGSPDSNASQNLHAAQS